MVRGVEGYGVDFDEEVVGGERGKGLCGFEGEFAGAGGDEGVVGLWESRHGGCGLGTGVLLVLLLL